VNLTAKGVDAIGTGIVTLHRRATSTTATRTGIARLYDCGEEALGTAIAEWLVGA
jgi:hypothetical protein